MNINNVVCDGGYFEAWMKLRSQHIRAIATGAGVFVHGFNNGTFYIGSLGHIVGVGNGKGLSYIYGSFKTGNSLYAREKTMVLSKLSLFQCL